MPKLFKNLSSKEVVKILVNNGFKVIHQKGSHIKMSFGDGNFGGHVVVPERKDIPQGTLRNIYNQAIETIGAEALDEHFKNFR
jgi:predicted RNA binding protein YcfA (HicA-like mRNA interferase family)